MPGDFQTVKIETHKIKRVGKRPFEPKADFHGYKAVRVGSFVFIPGFSDNSQANKFVWAVLDVKRNEWRRVNCQGPYLTRAPIIHNDTILHFGAGEEVPGPLTFCNLYDLVLREWSQCRPKGLAPSSRCKFAGGLIEKQDKYVLFGGRARGVTKNDVHLLAVQEKVWIQPKIKGSPPRARHKHTCCVRLGALYCYGEQDSQRRELQDGIFILQLSGSSVATWSHPKTTAVDRMPPGGAKMIPFQGAFLLYGKTGLFKYDPKTRRFSTVAAQTEFDFTRVGSYSTAIDLENGNEIGIFYGFHIRHSGYLRLSDQR